MSAGAKMGRPALPAGEKRDAVLILRLSAEEKRAVEEAADRLAGGNVSAWARAVVLAAAMPVAATVTGKARPVALARPVVPLDVQALIMAAVRLTDSGIGLSPVAGIVRTLAGRMSTAEVHEGLIAACDAGTLELRPEAGSEFLPDADAALCPPGPRGTVLAYVRRIGA